MSASTQPDGTAAAGGVGVVGLAVMGSNLARRGHTVVAFNRTQGRTEELLERFGQEGDLRGATTVEELVAGLSRPRRIILMVCRADRPKSVVRWAVPAQSARGRTGRGAP